MTKTSYKDVTLGAVRGYCSPRTGAKVYLDLVTSGGDKVELCLSEDQARKLLGRTLTGLRKIKRQRPWAASVAAGC